MTNAVNLASAAGTGFAFRNRIINGAMEIDQRNNGASVANANGYIVDRWAVGYSGSGRLSAQRSTTVPSGFKYSFLKTVTTSVTPTATDAYYSYQAVEGFNIADLDWGTATAKTITISFWVRSSVTGTYAGRVCNNPATRSYVFTYTISAANVWEYKTVTIPGDTTGTWAADNTQGLYLAFDLGSGSNYNAASANSWSAGNFLRTSGTVNFISTNGATFYLTGVQLEVGSVATPFERRLYGQEVALCQRYFCKSSSLNVVPVNGALYSTAGMFFSSVAGAYATTAAYSPFIKFPVTMRTEPTTLTTYNTSLPSPSTAGQWSIFSPTASVWYNCAVSAQSITQDGWGAALAGSWGSTGALPLYGAWAASAEL